MSNNTNQENNASDKIKEIQSAGVFEIEIKCINCLSHDIHKNKRKDTVVLILLLSKPNAFNILLLVFSQKPSEKKLQRKKPTIEARKHGH